MNKNAQIILDTINASTDHPTAEQVYLHLKEEYIQRKIPSDKMHFVR